MRARSLAVLLSIAAAASDCKPTAPQSFEVRPTAPEPSPSVADAAVIDASERDAVANAEPLPALEPELADCARPRTGPLPEIPAILQTEVDRYRATVRRTRRCYHSFFRTRMRAPAQCQRWFDELDRGGDAAMHAIGAELASASDGHCTSGYISAAIERLARSLAKSPRPEALLYLLRAVAMAVEQPQDHTDNAAWKAYEGLLLLAGGDVQTEIPPLTSHLPSLVEDFDRADEDAYEIWQSIFIRWLRWYDSHKNETPEQWRAQQLARTRADLRGASPYRAYVAAVVLYERSDDRAQVVSFVNELRARHASDDEPPALVRALDLYAGERRLPGGRSSEFRWR